MLEVLRYIAYIALNTFNCVHTKIKAMSKVSNMYVKDVEDGVCGFYATLHTEYCYSFCYSC